MEAIVITGYPGAGKDTVADMLVSRGWKKVTFSDALIREFERVKGRKPRDKMDLSNFAAEIRRERGRDIVARLVWEEASGHEKVVFVGSRSPEEVEFLRGRANVVVLLVDAPPEIRKSRRPDALEREEKERVLGIDEVVKLADAVILNDGTLEDLGQRVDYFLQNLHWYRLGLRAGLEIHQQLDTRKLFCSCPSKLSDEYTLTFERYLRPVASELGEYDPAAMSEFMKGRKYIYRANREVTCLVEMDEEPPHPPNREALETALMMALYLDLKVFPYIQVMRKMVIDGSNTSGFQRTMLIGVDGRLRTENTQVRIPTLCLEEDAARPVEKGEDYVVYNLDRLGIPLIEITTSPDMRTPAEVKEVAQRIGILLRSTGRVKRGLGTIRQDINVSIRGGARVEIKGVQSLDLMDRYVELEVERQTRLLELRDLLRERDVSVGPPADVTDIFRGTGAKFVRRTIERGGKVLGLCVKNGKGLIGFEVNPNRRFGTEIADYVKVHAGLGGILHSDELPAYGITENEVNAVRDALDCSENDAFILLVGDVSSTQMGYQVVKERIEVAKKGVPPETRSPREDGTTSYARPLPGAARMYPETDVAPVIVGEEDLEDVRTKLPPLPEERKEMYRKMGLSEKMVNDLIRDRHVFLFDYLVEKGVDPKLAASTILNKFPYWRREGIDVESIPDDTWLSLLLAYEKEYPKGAIDDVVRLVSQGVGIEEAIDRLGVRMLGEEETRKIVEDVLRDFEESGKEMKPGAIIGEVMRRTGGRASGKVVSKILKEVLGG